MCAPRESVHAGVYACVCVCVCVHGGEVRDSVCSPIGTQRGVYEQVYDGVCTFIQAGMYIGVSDTNYGKQPSLAPNKICVNRCVGVYACIFIRCCVHRFV